MQGDPITFKVNKLMSVKNLPYQFYSLPYCKPDKVRWLVRSAAPWERSVPAQLNSLCTPRLQHT